MQKVIIPEIVFSTSGSYLSKYHLTDLFCYLAI